MALIYDFNEFDYKNQTRIVKGKNGDEIRTLSLNKHDSLLSCCFEEKNLYDLFQRGLRVSNDGDCLGWKPSAKEPLKWLKYSQVNEIACAIGSALVYLGFEPAKETFIGIFAKNRPEWVLTEKACNAYSFVSVPFYDTFGTEAITFILKQTQIRLVVCDDSEKALQLMHTKTNLEYIVVIDNINQIAQNKAESLNIKLLTFENFKQIGRTTTVKPAIPPKPDDLVTICYTSGTTGTPKGALITHANMVAIISSIFLYVDKYLTKNEQQRYLSYLPLAHMLERNSQAFMFAIGGKIGFFQGDIKNLSEDLKEIKPTLFCTVPRLLNRVYSVVNGNIENASSLKKKIFKCAFNGKEKLVKKGKVRNNSIYDIAFKKIRANLGGEVKFVLTGSAPISPDVLHFLRVVCGCHVLEGYGATETGGASSLQVPGETTVGNVGPPFGCCMYKLIDVPEMNLVAKRDNKGEICAKGYNIFKGYYKDEEKTKEVLDNDGWYHTGDIGSWETNGTLKVVDRVKNIFKLQQGEYVAPEKIENIYVRSKYVAQVFVYGNSYKSSIIGIIVPEETVLFEWARDNNKEQDMKKLCSNSEVKKLIMDDLEKQAKNGDLKGFEKVRDIYLHHELFSIENGLLTSTMKSKRNELQRRFQKELDDMNNKLD